jgi:gamma-glutamylcyclotransferase (GGCT)/AIG2-like uncharacterized protein YtfP
MPLSDALAESAFMGHGKIDGALYDLGHYPGLRAGKRAVYGELYDVDQSTLDKLDQIEGYFPDDPDHSLYLRRQVRVRPFDGDPTIKAYSYFYRDRCWTQPIACGDYRRYRLEQLDAPQWYVAYGSNMSSARLRRRLGHDAVRDIETGYLEGYALRFNKRAYNGGVYANIVYRGPGCRCPFVAYHLDLEAINLLDGYEGEPDHYVRLGLPFPKADGRLGLGHVYVAAPERVIPDRTPDPDYLQHLLAGYEEHGFDPGALPGAPLP